MGMNLRPLLPVSASATILFSAGLASAEDAWPHSRVGATFGGGLVILPGVASAGSLDLLLHVGAQLNKYVGVYVTGFGGFVFPPLAGAGGGAAAIIDVTFDSTIFVGVGPELDWYEIDSRRRGGASGILAGGRLRFLWNPERLRPYDIGHTGFGFVFGADVRLLRANSFAFFRTGAPEARIMVAPVLLFGFMQY